MQHVAQDQYQRQRARLSINRRLAPRVPPKRTHAFRKAVDWLFPWKDAYPGFYVGICALLDCRLPTLKHWLAGRRAIPASVRDRLIEAMQARLDHGAAILAELKAYQPPAKKPPAFLRKREPAKD